MQGVRQNTRAFPPKWQGKKQIFRKKLKEAALFRRAGGEAISTAVTAKPAHEEGCLLRVWRERGEGWRNLPGATRKRKAGRACAQALLQCVSEAGWLAA